jgi:hypothetical protein
MLLAMHEGLLHSVNRVTCEQQSINFTQFLEETSSETNQDQMSCFWASMLDYINVYVGFFFAIRSGNFALRNACLPKLAELFFAYNHRKYQDLVCQHIKYMNSWPANVKAHLFTMESGQLASQGAIFIMMHWMKAMKVSLIRG